MPGLRMHAATSPLAPFAFVAWCVIKHKEDLAFYIYVWSFLRVPQQPDINPSTGCDRFSVAFGKLAKVYCGISRHVYRLTLPLSRFLSGKKCD